MSQINKKLNELSRKSTNSATAVPLQAATVRPVPKSQAPRWAMAGLCIATLAGAGGWWFGSQSQAEVIPFQPSQSEDMPVEPVNVVMADNSPKQDADALGGGVIPEPEQQAKIDPVAVGHNIKPAPAAPVKPANTQKSVTSVSPEIVSEKSSPTRGNTEANTETKAASVRKAPVLKTTGTQEPVTKSSTPKQSGALPEDAELQDQTQGLTIETVELDAAQLANVEYKKAQKAWEAGDSRKAISYLESVLNYQPEWVKARQKMAALYYGRGETRKAIAALQQGLVLNGEQPDLRLTMAKLLANESQPQAALNVLSQLPEKRHSGYLAMRGALAQKLNKNEMAMSSYQQLVKAEPYDGRWWMGLGIALERSEQADKARNAYQQALLMGQISPQSQQFIKQRLAALYSREG